MLRWLLNKFKGFRKYSYSQCGEDLIIDFIFKEIGVTDPKYLDIGAHHPVFLSNTFLFYERGCRGVCVEPDPSLFGVIEKKRVGDVCLNVGVGFGGERSADFYVMTHKVLNTFSRAEAERYEGFGSNKIEQVLDIPLVDINSIMRDYFEVAPNLISLDIEGLDLAVLRTIDFSRFRPEVLCIETITYSEDSTESKIMEIIDFCKFNGYLVYADTYINTIFVDKNRWTSRRCH